MQSASSGKAGDDIVTAVAQSIGLELLGRRLSDEELARVVRQVSARVATNNDVRRTKLTPPKVAKMLGVNADKVLKWIRSGELRAINVAAQADGRPRYRIDLEDLRAFEQHRCVVHSVPPVRRRRRPNSQDVIEFF